MNIKKYMALDIGSKTVGIAVSNTSIIAQAYKTIRFNEADYNRMYNLLKTEINLYKPNCIVLGYPKNMNNTVGEKALISEMVAKRIKEDFNDVEIFLEDERLTTVYSFKIMRNLKKSIKDKKRLKDELSAEIILQSFLDRKNG